MALLVHLPIELSLCILNEWIQIRDLAALDVAFCVHPKKKSATRDRYSVSRPDYLRILQNQNFILRDMIFFGKDALCYKYLKWLAKRGIKAEKLPLVIWSLPEVLKSDHLNLSKIQELHFMRSPVQKKSTKSRALFSPSENISSLVTHMVGDFWQLLGNQPNRTIITEDDRLKEKEEKETWDDSDLLLLSRALPTSVKAISFQSWKAVTNNQLTLLLSKANLQLQTINLSKCSEITDDALVLLCTQYSQSLESLNIACCPNVTGLFLSAIYSISQKLHTLNISYCHQIRGDLLQIFLERYHSLRHFLAEDLEIITNALIIDLVRNHPQLVSINIDYGRNVSIDCLNQVLRIQPNLQSFISKDCYYQYHADGSNVNGFQTGNKVRTYANAPIISRELMLKGCYTRQTALNTLLSNFPTTATRDGEEESTIPTAPSPFIGVQSVNAAECRKFGDFAIQTVAAKFSQSLLSLKLSPWKDIQLTSFLSLFDACRLLQIVNLSFCETLSDPVLLQISQKLPNLKELFVNYCPLITDEGMHAIIQSGLELRVLECENCLKITNLTIQRLFYYAPSSLQRVNMVATGITSHCFESLVAKPRLEAVEENNSFVGSHVVEEIETRVKNEERKQMMKEYWENNENFDTFSMTVSEYWRDTIYWKYYQFSDPFQKQVLKTVIFVPTQMSHNNQHHH